MAADEPYAIAQITPEGRVHDEPFVLREVLRRLDVALIRQHGDDGVNGLVIVAVRGEPSQMGALIEKALRS